MGDGCRFRSSKLASRDHAGLQSDGSETEPFLVVREIPDLELLEHRAQVGFHGLHAEKQLGRDFSVAGGGGVAPAVVQRAAQRDEDSPLGLGEVELLSIRGGAGRLAPRRERIVKGDETRAAANDLTVSQASPGRDPQAVDERSVARQTVVEDKPVIAKALQFGMHPRDLGVELQLDIASLAATDGGAIVLVAQREQTLRAIGGLVEEEGEARTFGGDALAQLLGG